MLHAISKKFRIRRIVVIVGMLDNPINRDLENENGKLPKSIFSVLRKINRYSDEFVTPVMHRSDGCRPIDFVPWQENTFSQRGARDMFGKDWKRRVSNYRNANSKNDKRVYYLSKKEWLANVELATFTPEDKMFKDDTSEDNMDVCEDSITDIKIEFGNLDLNKSPIQFGMPSSPIMVE